MEVEIGKSCGAVVEDGLVNSLWNRLGYRLRNRLGYRLWNRLGNRLESRLFKINKGAVWK